MSIKNKIPSFIIAAAIGASSLATGACSATTPASTTTSSEAAVETSILQTVAATVEEETSAMQDAGQDSGSRITEDQALEAVTKYLKENYAVEENQGEAPCYVESAETSEDEIVVVYRSYTAALTFFRIDPVTGETVISELVPGVVDQETPTGEKINIRDYMA